MNSKIIATGILFILLSISFIGVNSKIIRDNIVSNIGKSSSPNLKISPDSLSWNWIKPGSIIIENFTIENCNDSGLASSWLFLSPNWGEWNFMPVTITDLEPEDGEVVVDFEVLVPEENNSDFGGEIKIVNLDNPSEYYTISISVTTPKNCLIENNYFMGILNRFTNLKNLCLSFVRG